MASNKAQQTVTIEFKAKGDEVLIETIKNLDKATKGLIKAQQTITQVEKKKTKSTQKYSSQVEKLIIDLKLEGKTLNDVKGAVQLKTRALKGDRFALEKLRRTTKKYILDLKKQKRGLFDTAHATRILGGSFAVLRSRMLLVSFGMTIFGATIGKVVQLSSRQEKAEKKLSSALKSTAHSAGLTHRQLTLMASGLQSVTNVGDEALIETQALLLTFTRIQKDVFPKALEAVLNVSEAMGQDLKSSAVQVGKALNDPVTGLTALRRVGIQFSKEQELAIKKFDKTNNLASAQAIILQELQTQFGGLARSVKNTAIGSFTALGNSFGDMLEQIGSAISPFLESLSNSLEEITFIMKSEGEQQLIFLEKIGASEETISKARINLLKEEATERLKTIGISNLDLTSREKLNEVFGVQNQRLQTLKGVLNTQSQSLDSSTSKLMDMTSTSAEFNKELKRSNQLINTGTHANSALGGALVTTHMANETTVKGLAHTINFKQQDIKATKEQIESTQNAIFAIQDLMIALGLLDMKGQDFKKSFAVTMQESIKSFQVIGSQFSALTSTMSADITARENAELEALRNTDAYRNASSESQKNMEKKKTQIFAQEKLRLFNMEKASNISNAIMNTATAVTKVIANPILAGIVGAMGAIQLGIIMGQKPPKFERGGLVGGNRHSQGGTIIEAERGEFVMSRNAVESIGINSLEAINQGTSPITLNISAPLVDETIIDTIIPAIEKAQRMNLA